MRRQKTLNIVLAAAFAAAITALTMVHLPLPSEAGYVHVGDSMIYLAASFLPAPYAIIAAAIGAILISFLSPFVAFVNSIPSCVMGGVCMALYGFIAVSGLKMLQQVDLGQNRNLFVVSTILIAGLGGLSVTFGKVTLTAVACALILGILVNIMLSKEKPEAPEE
jgi:uracil permease